MFAKEVILFIQQIMHIFDRLISEQGIAGGEHGHVPQRNRRRHSVDGIHLKIMAFDFQRRSDGDVLLRSHILHGFIFTGLRKPAQQHAVSLVAQMLQVVAPLGHRVEAGHGDGVLAVEYPGVFRMGKRALNERGVLAVGFIVAAHLYQHDAVGVEVFLLIVLSHRRLDLRRVVRFKLRPGGLFLCRLRSLPLKLRVFRSLSLVVLNGLLQDVFMQSVPELRIVTVGAIQVDVLCRQSRGDALDDAVNLHAEVALVRAAQGFGIVRGLRDAAQQVVPMLFQHIADPGLLRGRDGGGLLLGRSGRIRICSLCWFRFNGNRLFQMILHIAIHLGSRQEPAVVDQLSHAPGGLLPVQLHNGAWVCDAATLQDDSLAVVIRPAVIGSRKGMGAASDAIGFFQKCGPLVLSMRLRKVAIGALFGAGVASASGEESVDFILRDERLRHRGNWEVAGELNRGPSQRLGVCFEPAQVMPASPVARSAVCPVNIVLQPGDQHIAGGGFDQHPRDLAAFIGIGSSVP